MKKIYNYAIKGFLIVTFALFANLALAQNIQVQQVNVSANPTDCNTFTVTSSGTIWSLSYTVTGYSYAVSPGLITIKLVFADPFIILPAIGQYSHTATVNTANNIPAGNYTVKVEAWRGVNFESSMTTTTSVAACCVMNTNIATSDQFICLGDSAMLVSNSPGAIQYNWYDNTGQSVSTNDSLGLHFTTPGAYTYILEADNGACNGFDTVTVQVDTVPSFDLGGDLTFCADSTLSIDASISDPNATYLWSGGNTSASLIPDSTGTYSVTVNINACSSQDSINVTVNPNPIIFLPNDTAVCFNETVTLDVTQAGLTYSWNTGSTSSSLIADSSATYVLTVADANNCTATDDFTLTVHPEIVIGLADTASIATASDSIQLDAGVWASYSWSTGDTTQTIFVSSSNIYTVTVTDVNGCMATDNINVTVVGNENVAIPMLNVYPNPAQEVLNIHVGQLMYLIEKVAIYNNLGQLVGFGQLENGSQINIGQLPTGIYFVRLFDVSNKTLGIARFIKE